MRTLIALQNCSLSTLRSLGHQGQIQHVSFLRRSATSMRLPQLASQASSVTMSSIVSASALRSVFAVEPVIVSSTIPQIHQGNAFCPSIANQSTSSHSTTITTNNAYSPPLAYSSLWRPEVCVQGHGLVPHRPQDALAPALPLCVWSYKHRRSEAALLNDSVRRMSLSDSEEDIFSGSNGDLDAYRVSYSKRQPRVFEAAPLTMYFSPAAIQHLAEGLWNRSRPACTIMNVSIPRGHQFDDINWSPDSVRMLETPNAGGSSLLSEVLSCELLVRALGASLSSTEMEIRYLYEGQPITDYSIRIPGLSIRYQVGVSVTRAFAFRGPYTRSQCRKLLTKKLKGIQASTKNVCGERFFKQILHCWVPDGKVAKTVTATYKRLPFEVTRNTVVLVSVVNAGWVFSNLRKKGPMTATTEI